MLFAHLWVSFADFAVCLGLPAMGVLFSFDDSIAWFSASTLMLLSSLMMSDCFRFLLFPLIEGAMLALYCALALQPDRNSLSSAFELTVL